MDERFAYLPASQIVDITSTDITLCVIQNLYTLWIASKYNMQHIESKTACNLTHYLASFNTMLSL